MIKSFFKYAAYISLVLWERPAPCDWTTHCGVAAAGLSSVLAALGYPRTATLSSQTCSVTKRNFVKMKKILICKQIRLMLLDGVRT